MAELINDKAAVVGIGQTAFGKGLPDTELSLACQAIALALDDAGIAPSEVDGLASYTMEPNREVEVARSVGLGDITYFSQVGFGGGAGCGVIGQAAMAVATGQCTVAVAWRARKRADPASRPWAQAEARLADSGQWTRPFGILRPVDEIAMLTRRYMHEYGGTRDHLANVALAFRKHASMNPAATMGHKPMTRDDYMNARWISEPLCLFDNCLETDGALAVVITSADRAIDTRQPPAWIHAFAQGLPPQHQTMTNYFTDDPLRGPAWTAAKRLWANAGVGPDDVKVAQLYDAFSPLIPLSLEGYGFCARGEGGSFTDDGAIEGPDGRLPVNTSGGGMSEAYVHGFNLVLEGVRQIRGTSTCQVPDADVSLVTSGEGVPTSAVIFTKDRGVMEGRWLLPDLAEPTSAPFWAGTARGELLVQACGECGRRRMPPRPMCPHCRSTAVTWEPTSGRGRVWSYIVPHPPLLPAFSQFGGYNAIVVELEEDPTIRFAGNLVTSASGAINEIDPATIVIGEPVRVVFAPIDDVFLPRWVRAVKDTYPLEPEGVGDYPIKVGSLLLTLVDPHQGYERAYNRWYERDHFYAGCMIGPFLFAGSWWVAPRDLKARRWPAGDTTIANPTDAGSYVAIYFVEQGHHEDHFSTWARPQVNALYGEGRGFAERRHIHTVLFDHLGAAYRDDDPVPVELALDHGYDGIVLVWFDGIDRDAGQLHADLARAAVPELLAGSTIEIVSSWTPSAGENEPRNVPMDLGSKAGGPERLLQMCFVRGDVRDTLAALHAYTDRVEGEGLATTHLVAPFFRTVVGTDTYVDELW